ncbi:hypothetical protein [Methanosarcina siciliae]|uniref:hypothetical protein n=1 Tax=Methanosarcina siciliae TaxID=38027 RepID=UPI000B05C006|nr:hypothetical protein [Methanosarcina siciliae]
MTLEGLLTMRSGFECVNDEASLSLLESPMSSGPPDPQGNNHGWGDLRLTP